MSRKVVSSVVGFALVFGAFVCAAEPVAPFKVIVNPSVVGHTVSRRVLAQVYLGSVARWGNGSAIAIVDLSSTSPVRQAFSEQVLGMSIDAVKYHWLRKIASGQRPPIAKPADEDVIAFVATQPGGVGYVSSTTPIPPTVQEVSVQ
jgi:ABC-type phosphate transport system substrate-binding protein